MRLVVEFNVPEDLGEFQRVAFSLLALDSVQKKLGAGIDSGKVVDVNGNTVGHFNFREGEVQP